MLENNEDMSPEERQSIELISQTIYREISSVYDRERQSLRSQYSKYNWKNEEVKRQIEQWIVKALATGDRSDSLMLKVMKVLNYFMNSSFFIAPEFINLMTDVRQAISPQSERPRDAALKSNLLNDKAITILLLDAENLNLNPDIETFLAGVCTYPIQIKIAFGNWRNLGKKDSELHNRGYELIHVPAGKDSADVKMATVGSSIFVHYPNAKEVLVCSSDGVLTHLCNTLQTHGLNVYLVRQEDENIIVLNTKNGQTKTYAIGQIVKPISTAEFIERLKKLIKEQQLQTKQSWIQLSALSAAYANKYKVALERAIETTFPERSFKDIFAENSNYFALHQMLKNGEFYVTLFGEEIESHDDSSLPQNETETHAVSSAEQFQKVIETLVQELTDRHSSTYISISKVAVSFHSKCGQPVTTAMKKLGLGKKFLPILQTYKNLEVKKVGNEHQVRKLK